MRARLRRFARWTARAGLTLMLVLSLVLAGWSAVRIARDPLLRPVIDRVGQDLAAAVEREMAGAATPQAVTARMWVLLAETPRNWIALEAVEEIAMDRAIDLPADLVAARQAAWDEDSGYLSIAGACLSCTVDAASCSLSQALICNAPVAFTPVGDAIGIGKAGYAAATGAEVDRLDLALSLIGLGATVAVAATGGTSYTLKAGAGLLKLARKMSLVPPRLLALVTEAARNGIRWDEALRWDSVTDPARLLNPAAVAPVAAVASDLGRLDAALGSTRTLHLLRHIDGPDDARRLTEAVHIMGPRTLGTLEILGKSRFMRAAIRYSDEAAALVAGLAGLMLSLGLAVSGLIQSLCLRALRRGLRHAAR